MKSGRTIIAERERLQSASERLKARKTARRKRGFKIVIAILLLAIVAIIVVSVWQYISKRVSEPVPAATTLAPTVQIVDESGTNQVSARIKEYIALLEKDFSDQGLKIERVSLPAGSGRELYLNLTGRKYYLKAIIDRGSAVTAEDAKRMLKYLDSKGITPAEYVDLRTPEKAYYK